MKSLKIYLLLILIFFLGYGQQSVFGQTDSVVVNLSQPDSILGCNDNFFTVSMTVSSVTVLEIHIEVRDSSNSIADTSCVGVSPVLFVLTSTDPLISNAVYDPITSTWSCTIDSGTVNFAYSLVVDCSVIQMSGGGVVSLSNTHLFQQWTNSDGDFFNINSTIQNQINSPSIFSPYLIDISPGVFYAAYGNAVDLFFEFRNDGIDANVKFWFDPDGFGTNCNAYVQFDSIYYAIRDTTGNFVGANVYSSGSWTSVPINHGESIVIARQLIIQDCLDACNFERALFKWRCDYSAGTDTLFCDDCQQTFIHNYTILEPDSLRPYLELVRVLPTGSDAIFDFSCPGDPVQWAYTITNTGLSWIPSAQITLSFYGDTSRMLTQVPISSLIVDTTACTVCHLDSTITPRITPALCGLPDELLQFDMTLHELGPSESIIVAFNTIKCCSDNEAMYLNQEKKFNHWSLFVSVFDSCGKVIDNNLNNGTDNPYAGLPVNYQIAGIAQDNKTDLDLKLQFIPSVTDLTVPAGDFFGPSVAMNMTFQGLFTGPDDYQLLGCDDTPGCLFKGYLRARIHTELGLHIRDFAGVYFQFDTLPLWIPEFYNTDKPDTSICDVGNYYFYFNLSDSVARTMLEKGDFFFTLQSCCDAAPVTAYDVAFHLLMNPDSCITITPPSSILDFPDCPGCCWLPLSSEGDEINIHCPGCMHPGIIVDDYRLERTTYGLQDDNNDGIADSPSTQIEKYDSYYQSHNLIRSKFSMHGDILEDVMVAHFEPGTSYSYTQMITSPSSAVLDYLQLNRFMEYTSNQFMNLTATEIDLYIDIRDTTGGCRHCAEQQVTDTMYRTIQQNHIPLDSLISYLQVTPQGNDNYYLYTFGVDTVLNNNLFRNIVYQDSDTNLWFTGFFENQRYRLVTRYSVCGNWESYTNDDHWQQSNIRNHMYLTGSPKDWDAADIKPPNSDTLFTFPVDSNFANDYLFYCEKFGGRHFYCSTQILNQSGIGSDGCGNTMGIVSTVHIGGNNNKIDLFPFEFRTPSIKPSSFRIELPPGMTLSSIGYYSELPGTFPLLKSVTVPFPNLIPDFDNVFTFTDTLFTTPHCFTDSVPLPLDQNLYEFDQIARITMLFDVDLGTCEEGFVMNQDSVIFIEFTDNTSGCLAYPDSICTPLATERANLYGNYIYQPNPNLHLQFTSLNVNASETTICWEFTFENPNDTSLHGPAAAADQTAYNVYLIPPDSSLFPFFTKWTVFIDGTPYYPDTNGVLHIINSLPKNKVVSGHLCVSFLYCDNTDVDSLGVTWGWNCDDYPIPGDTIASCNENLSYIHFSLSNGDLAAQDKFATTEITLCDTIYFGTVFHATDMGLVYPDSLFLTNIPPGFTIVDAYIAADSASTILDSLQLTPFVTEWGLTETMLNDIGFDDAGFASPFGIQVSYFAILDCKYDLTLPSHNIVYHKYCGDTITFTVDHSTPLSLGGSNCDHCFTIDKTPLQADAYVGDTVTYQVVVCGNNALADTLTFSDLLPLNFVATSTIPGTVNVPANGCDTILISGYYTEPGYCGFQDMFNTATIYINGDSLSSEACIPVYEPCAALADTIIPDSTFTTSSATISGMVLYLAGRVYINDVITLVNCHLLVSPGGQIIVTPGASLILDSTVVEGCDFMWQGIYMDTTSILAVRKHSAVRDADIAVYANDDTDLKLLDSDFENNIRGLLVPPNGSGMNNITHAITGNSFGMPASSFKFAYPGQPTFGNIPYSGVEVNDVLMQICDADADSNWFYNMNTGILAFNSYIHVVNNKFEDIQTATGYGSPTPFFGKAVSTVGDLNNTFGALWFEPVTSGAMTVERCQTGVYSYYSYLLVDRVGITQADTGAISRYSTDLLENYILGCHIEATGLGIDWRLNSGSNLMIADGNEIVISGANTAGIWLREQNTAGNANYTILGNHIEATDGAIGIAAQNIYGANINFNSVKISGTPASQMIGIGLNNNDSSLVSCNTIFGDDNTDTLKVGVLVTLSQKTHVICNSTDSTGFGFFFGGQNFETVFNGNILKDHYDGLRLNSVAVIDTQSHAGNRWVGSYGNFGAVNLNAASSQNLLASLFEVNPSPNATLLPSTPDAFSGPPAWPDDAGWFDVLPTGNAFDCVANSDCGESSLTGGGGSEALRFYIANDSTLTSDFIPESKALARSYLYEKLKGDTLLIYSHESLETFFYEKQSRPTGYLFEVRKALKNSYFSNSTLSTSQILYDNINTVKDSVLILDSFQRVLNEPDWITIRKNLIRQINELRVQIASLTSNRKTEITELMNFVIQYNNSIQTEDIPEANEKFINQLELLNIISGIEAISEFEFELLEVASQCPYKGGNAVYRARTLLSLINDSEHFSDFEICTSNGINRSVPNTVPSISEVKILPNPASQTVDIALSNHDKGICSLSFENILNEEILLKSFNCIDKKMTIDISRMTPGVYTVKTYVDNNYISAEKLIIIR